MKRCSSTRHTKRFDGLRSRWMMPRAWPPSSLLPLHRDVDGVRDGQGPLGQKLRLEIAPLEVLEGDVGRPFGRWSMSMMRAK